MSENANQRHVRCYFGILNLGGLMDMRDTISSGVKKYSQVVLPIFSTQSYTIKTTFNRNLTFKQKNQDGTDKTSQHFALLHFNDAGNVLQNKFYQKKFRRDVIWDFGDGTKIIGYSAQHSYAKPGRYRITCSFYDINRRTWVNDYSIYVIVKEIIPSILRFDDKLPVKNQIVCSKIERICRIEALNSNTIKDKLQIKGNRIFTEQQHEENHPELSCVYNELPKSIYKHMSRYWTFLENTQTLFYNSDKVHSNYLKSGDLFTPRYTDLYGKFFYSEEWTDELGVIHESKLDLSIYQVIPYKHIDDNLKTIKLLDFNKSILDGVQVYQEFPITQLYREEQLPQDVFYLGRRGFCDIFYKNDFKRNENVLNFIYDVEQKNITGQLESSDNYLNIQPIGLIINVINNKLDDIKIGISSNGFLHDLEDESFVQSTNNTYIDPYFYNSLFKGLDVDALLFPFVPYDDEFYIEGADDLVIDVYQGGVQTYNKMYYIPKDFNIQLKCLRIKQSNQGNSSYINHGLGDDLTDEDLLNRNQNDFITGIRPWFYRIPIVLQDYVDIIFQVKGNIIDKTQILEWNPRLTKLKLKSCQDIVIPKQIQTSQDFERLLNVYMSHPMFEQTDNLKDALRAYLGNGFLSNILTASDNFLDDTTNVKTCYLSNLISMLKMMGEDVTQFEKSSFEGVNDLKKFVRLLSMNHTDLVGHVISQQYDISYNGFSKGENIGDELFIDDILFLNNTLEDKNLGKIISVKRKNSDTVSSINYDGGVDLVVADKYTNQTKIVRFYPYQKLLGEQGNTMYSSVSLRDYEPSWGWNLLLPDSFDKFTKEIELKNEKIYDKRYSQSQRNKFKDQVEQLKKRRGDLVDGYYKFFLLNPKLQDVRLGNFLDESYINQPIENCKSWDEKWGITHDVLMKIYIENCFLKNERKIDGIYNDGTVQPIIPEYITSGEIFVTKQLGQEVPYLLSVNGVQRGDVQVNGNITVSGTIEDSGTNYLIVSTNQIIVDNFSSISLVPSKIEVRVNYDGTIDENYQTYKLLGNNLTGDLTVKVKGTVENFETECFLKLDFIDQRIANQVVFDSSNIFTTIKDHYYTNLRRQLNDNGGLSGGFVKNESSSGKQFKVSLKFDENAKLGENNCKLNVVLNLGKPSFNGSSSVNQKKIILNDYETVVKIDYDGQISFNDGMQIIKIHTSDYGQLMEGDLYFKLSGNAVLGSHKLECFTFNPNEINDGIKTLLVEVGGYERLIVNQMIDSFMMVDGQNGFDSGYYAKIISKGTVFGQPQTQVQVDAIVDLEIYDKFNNKIYTATTTHKHISNIDENAYLEQKSFIVKFDDEKIKGHVVFDVFGGYYDMVGFVLNVTLK